MSRMLLLSVLVLVSTASGQDRNPPSGAGPVPALPVVHLPSGEECIAGQVIIKLDKSLRGSIESAVREGIIQVGVPVLDKLCRRFGVTGFQRIMRHPRPSRLALNMGLDMQYLLSFDASLDVQQVIQEFEDSPLVDHACPNALLTLHGQTGTVPPQEGLSPLVPYDTPDDPRYSEQWHLPHIRAPRAWDIAHGDSNVAIAVLDVGLKWNHPDHAANLWINSAEDINANGRFDPQPPPDGDLDGLDQDRNGYADDVIGWDFMQGDPNPMEQGNDNHGTMGYGTANAVTDNDTGIAAPPWNVSNMVLRCGQNGYVSLNAAIAAIYYAVPQGVWSVSMPWGSTRPYQPLADACLFMWQSGALGVGSAGSSGNETRMYPAAHEGVIAVAASDRNDYKTSFSNYGTWIDVCAPGIDLLTTTGNSGYTFWSGTSASCDLVTGVLGWFKSAYPGIDNDSALALLQNLCDSMPDPLYLQGKLGAGRIAMASDISRSVRPEKILSPSSVVDSGMPITPRIVVRNIGDETADSIDIHFIIDDQMDRVIYADSTYLLNMPGPSVETIMFTPWVAVGRDSLGCMAWTFWSGDSYVHDDTIASRFLVRVRDIAILDVKFSQTGETLYPDTARILAHLANYGNVTLRFPLLTNIGMMFDTVWVESLAPGESLWVASDTYRLRVGVWVCNVRVSVAGDLHPENNDTSFVFYVRGAIDKDVACEEILVPSGVMDTLPFLPRARYANYGTSDVTCTTYCRIEDTVTDVIVYSDRVPVLLVVGDTLTVAYRPCTLKVEGPYMVACSIHLVGDQNWLNNFIHQGFRVGAGVGIEGEPKLKPKGVALEPTVVRGILAIPLAADRRQRATLHDPTGRLVMVLKPGDNVIRHVTPGVYFVRTAEGGSTSAVRKVVIQR
ncbi:MAG: S8 family serine peptidase [candidate division WOR-3 bacterium]|nr:MAG: S8 family serine peptidase [candidate division WOR-3 bacterium]